MYKNLLFSLCIWTLSCTGLSVLADDSKQCLACHEPAEDWAGMSIDEIIAAAMDPQNKRHKGNQALSEEQLRLIIAKLLPQ